MAWKATSNNRRFLLAQGLTTHHSCHRVYCSRKSGKEGDLDSRDAECQEPGWGHLDCSHHVGLFSEGQGRGDRRAGPGSGPEKGQGRALGPFPRLQAVLPSFCPGQGEPGKALQQRRGLHSGCGCVPTQLLHDAGLLFPPRGQRSRAVLRGAPGGWLTLEVGISKLSIL